jgi:hypothetical protein
MKGYKYIGTEEQLVECGYTLVNDIDIRAIKRTKEGNVFIAKLDNRVSTFNHLLYDDLIDKGLVVEDE